MAATSLFDACFDLLGACADALALSPGGAPSRAFVSPGIPAWDCENQLTVHAGGPALADTAPLAPPLQPGVRVPEGIQLNLVTMTATILRCVPNLQSEGQNLALPSEESMNDASEVTLGDCWAIWNHLATVKRNGTLFPPRLTRAMFFDPAVALNPGGGIGGWQLQFRVQLDGYRTVD